MKLRKTSIEIRHKNYLIIGLAGLLFCLGNNTYAEENKSIYSKEVTIPDYDTGNSEHFLISSKEDWLRINDNDKRFFYVEPNADYGFVTITADGTAEKRRYLSLYNGNDTHPAKLSKSEQANVQLNFEGANYWIVDRMSSIDYTDLSYENEKNYRVQQNSGNIILNRLHFTNFFKGIRINGTDTAPYTHDITIQNSRFDRMSPHGIDNDNVAIDMFGGPSYKTPGTIINTHILNNEIVNCNDGIQPVKMTQFVGNGSYYVDYPGTIIDYNHIYVTNEVYTDGSGNHNPDGFYAWTENALDIKGGSNDPNNPMIISNNYLWGYRTTDKNGGGSGSWGSAFGGHFYVENLIIKDNVIFDSNRGINIDDTFDGAVPYSGEDILVTGNILYDIGKHPGGSPEYGNLFYDTKNVIFEKNTIVDNDLKSRWFVNHLSAEKITVSCNVIIDSYKMTGARANDAVIKDNYFYGTELQEPGDGSSYGSTSTAKMSDLTFITDTYTNNPRDITLPSVVTTAASPHANGCFGYKKLGNASIPNPPDGGVHISTTIDFTWLPGNNAISHDLYFGESNPPEFVQNQNGVSYDPGKLKNLTTYYWRVDAKNDSETIEGSVWSFKTISEDGVITALNAERTLSQGDFYINTYPNPFNSVTNISINLPEEGHISVKIYNLKGEEIAEPANAIYHAGSHTIVWAARDAYGNKVSSGLFFCRIQFKDQVITSKVLYVQGQ